jgi:hypothetical protein
MQLLGAHNIISLKNMDRLVSRNLHRGSLVNSSIYQIADGRPAEIVRDETLILIPLFTRLLPESDFNTCLVPFLSEVCRVEHGTILSEKFLEHPDEFG